MRSVAEHSSDPSMLTVLLLLYFIGHLDVGSLSSRFGLRCSMASHTSNIAHVITVVICSDSLRYIKTERRTIYPLHIYL